MRVIRGLFVSCAHWVKCPLRPVTCWTCERGSYSTQLHEMSRSLCVSSLKRGREIEHRLEGGPNSSPRRFSSPSLLRKLNETESQRLNSRRKHIVNIVEIHNENGLCLMCVESSLLSLSNNSSDHHDWLLRILLYFSHHVTRRGEYLDLL